MPPGDSTCLHLQGLADLPADAQALLATAPGRSMQLGAPWFSNYCKTLGHAFGEPQFAVLRDGHRCLAVLPMALQRNGRSRHLTALANYFSSLYAPSLHEAVDATALARLVRDTLRQHQPVTHLQFGPMDPAGREFALLQDALRQSGLVTLPYYCFGNWYLPVRGQRWADYLASRPGELRSTVKRMSRRLAQAGGTLELITGGERLAAGIEAYQKIYAASWKQPEQHPGFVSGLMRTCAEQGWLRLGLAWLQGQPVAAQLWIVAAGRAEIYKLAYDEASKAYSPGTLLTAMLMEHALDQDQVQEVDYLTGDDAYKAAWMTQRRERWGLVAHNIRTAAGAAGAATGMAGWAWRKLRGRPTRPAPPAALP